MMPWLRFLLVAVVLLMSLGGSGSASARQVPVPSSGAYLGLLTQIQGLSPGQAMARRESEFSRTFNISSHYYDWGNGFPSSRWEPDDVAHGRIPMITWWGTRYAAINNGSQDRVIRTAARNVKAFGRPVFLRWAAEMNGNWFVWSGPQNNNNPAGFVAAWRHIHDIFTAQGVKNVSWVWSPNFRSAPGGFDASSWNSWRNYYPGGEYVDWVGIDGYNWGTLPAGDGWQPFGAVMKPVYDDYASRKPIMIAETGSTESGGDKGQWITDMGKWAKAHKAIKAVVYFDRTTPWGWDWSLDTSKTSANAFDRLAADPYFNPRGSSPSGRAIGVFAQKVQRQRHRRVRVKIRLTAGRHRVAARATGSVKLPHGKLSLRSRSDRIGVGKRATVALRLKKRRGNKKVMRALKHRKKVHAAVRVRFTYESDNRAHRRVVVKLK